MKTYRIAAILCSALGLLAAGCSGSDADLPALATAAADVTPSAELQIEARGTKYDTDTLVVPVNSEVVITFRNRDSALHNVAIYTDDGAQGNVYRGDLFEGDDTKEYRFQAPGAGVYYFRCDAHPDMDGAFIVK